MKEFISEYKYYIGIVASTLYVIYTAIRIYRRSRQ